MSDIDEILADVERWTGKCDIASGDILTLTFRVRCMGVCLYGDTDENGLVPHGALALERAFHHAPILAAEVRRLRAEEKRLRIAIGKINDEVCQSIGRALGYPWFKDDQKNFPGATEADGVCVGEHVAESIAEEAAKRIRAIGLAVAEYFAADEIATKEMNNAEPDQLDHGELVEAMHRLTVATTTLKNLTMIRGIK